MLLFFRTLAYSASLTHICAYTTNCSCVWIPFVCVSVSVFHSAHIEFTLLGLLFARAGIKQSKLSSAPYLGKLHVYALNDFHFGGIGGLVCDTSCGSERDLWLLIVMNVAANMTHMECSL